MKSSHLRDYAMDQLRELGLMKKLVEVADFTMSPALPSWSRHRRFMLIPAPLERSHL